MNLDPDPGFRPNLDQDSGLCNKFLTKKVNYRFGGKKFLSTNIFFKKLQGNNSNGRNFLSVGSMNGELLSSILHLLLLFILFLPVWIRIHKAAENVSNFDRYNTDLYTILYSKFWYSRSAWGQGSAWYSGSARAAWPERGGGTARESGPARQARHPRH